MGAPVEFIPWLASVVADTFPELEGKAIPVSEIDPFNDKTNVPSLPIATVALVSETGNNSPLSNRITMDRRIVVDFIFPVERYKSREGAESPFYSYYPYEAIRNRLLAKLSEIVTPDGARIGYRSFSMDSDERGVYLSFTFTTSSTGLCLDDYRDDPVIISLDSDRDMRLNRIGNDHA